MRSSYSESVDESRWSLVQYSQLHRKVPPTSFAFKNISYWITTKKGQRKQVLDEVSGFVPAGHFLAIMGPSGAGKTSLLDVIAGRNKSGEVHGIVLSNGRPVGSNFNRVSGYVMQDSVFIETLTVRETLFYALRLRRKNLRPKEKVQLIDDIIEVLNLKKVEHTRVGNPEQRGISGGERRRLSIGTEIVTSPSIIFMDEPTSGLDATNALRVMTAIHNLCVQYGHTVICTLHQPRSNIFNFFDFLLLVDHGKTVYFGKASESVAYFSKCGIDCPPFINPADFLLDMLEDSSNDNDTNDNNDSDDDNNILQNLCCCFTDNNNNNNTNTNNDKDNNTTDNDNKITDISFDEEDYAGDEPVQKSLAQTYDKTHINNSDDGTDSRFVTDNNNTNTNNNNIDDYDEDDMGTVIRRPGAISSLQLPSHFLNSKEFKNLQKNLESENSLSNFGSKSFEDSFNLSQMVLNESLGVAHPLSMFDQYGILVMRTWVATIRDTGVVHVRTIAAWLIALLVGVLFFQQADTPDTISARQNTILFLICVFALFGLPAIVRYINDRLLYTRERASGYYQIFPHFLSVLTVEFPVLFFIVVGYGSISYWMVGLDPNIEHFLFFLLSVFAIISVGLGFAQFISAASPSVPVAIAIYMFSLVYSLLLGGFIVRKQALPYGISWMVYSSYFWYGFESLMLNEFSDKKYAEGTLRDLGIYGDNKWISVASLGVIWLLLQTIAFIVLLLFNKEKR